MKKIVSMILVCVLAMSLMACGGKEVEDASVCSIEQNGVKITMAFDVKGDKIVKIKQSSTINIEGYSEEDVELLQATIDEAASAYKDIEGVEYSIDQKDAQIIENININVGNKDTLKEVVGAGLLPVDDKNVTKLSLKATTEALESSGWTVESK